MPSSLEAPTVLSLTAASGGRAGPLRHALAVSLARRCTTLVGPNAAGKSNVLEAMAIAMAELLPERGVLHVPAATDPSALVASVAPDAAFLSVLEARFLEEAHAVVPEVATVSISSGTGGSVRVHDRHGMDFSASAGLRASFALGLLRALVEVDRAPSGLLIEEPGAFLHPAAQEALRDRMQHISAETGVPVVVTSETPFVIPRGQDDLVVALTRDESGNPVVVATTVGDDPQASLIGGLFRDPGLGAVLDRAARLATGTRAVVVFEGGTDEAYLRLAADTLGRADELDGVAIVPAGGASAAALQAVVLRAETDLPLLVVLDNDDPGRMARDTLVKRLSFRKRREVTTYAEVLPGYPHGAEAEDMFDHLFMARFVQAAGPDSITGKTVLWGKRDDPVWHHDLTSSAKSAFVGWAREHAQPADLPGWAALLDVLAERLAPENEAESAP